jgi:hypothetical protein
MNQDQDKNNEEETLEGVLYKIIYHTGVFIFKIMLIVSLWIIVLDFLKNLLL